ncbi:MAG TPA: hypothetical protein VH352_12705 [Pseudonocardiaceae bacterium]|nr:hypothetical protein [Pseudonocardiaceae bacterium]
MSGSARLLRPTAVFAIAGSFLAMATLPVAAATIEGPAVPAASAAPVPQEACFHFNENNVPIRETPGGPIVGRGQDRQLFVSDPPTIATQGGKTWVRGIDEHNAVSGWVYIHNLTPVSCS